ncbi:hypothetical protein Q9189_002551 [Teloschistes chrysophthalmus]
MSADTFPVDGSTAQAQRWVKEVLSSMMPPEHDYNHAMVVSNVTFWANVLLLSPLEFLTEKLGDELAAAFVVLAKPRTEYNEDRKHASDKIQAFYDAKEAKAQKTGKGVKHPPRETQFRQAASLLPPSSYTTGHYVSAQSPGLRLRRTPMP